MLAFFFSPSGRFGRAKWWLAQLAGLPVVGTFFFLITMLRSATGPQPSSLDLVMSLPFIVLFVLLFWMMFCATVKRYHDRNKSGWWYLIQFIPLIGGIWALVELERLPTA